MSQIISRLHLDNKQVLYNLMTRLRVWRDGITEIKNFEKGEHF